mgnify:CR=1 FL=1
MVEWKKLGDVYKFQNGLAFKSELFKAEGVPIFRIAKITDNIVKMNFIRGLNYLFLLSNINLKLPLSSIPSRPLSRTICSVFSKH